MTHQESRASMQVKHSASPVPSPGRGSRVSRAFGAVKQFTRLPLNHAARAHSLGVLWSGEGMFEGEGASGPLLPFEVKVASERPS